MVQIHLALELSTSYQKDVKSFYASVMSTDRKTLISYKSQIRGKYFTDFRLIPNSIIMKVSIYVSSNYQFFPTLRPTKDNVKIPKSRTPKPSLKPSALSNSLNTSFSLNHEFQEEEKLNSRHINGQDARNFDLPIVVRHSGRVSRCVWDGEELKLVPVDGVNEFCLGDFLLNYEDGVRKLVRVCEDAVRNFFLPREVSSNYFEYVKWKFLHRVFSSALQVLATQVI